MKCLEISVAAFLGQSVKEVRPTSRFLGTSRRRPNFEVVA